MFGRFFLKMNLGSYRAERSEVRRIFFLNIVKLDKDRGDGKFASLLSGSPKLGVLIFLGK